MPPPPGLDWSLKSSLSSFSVASSMLLPAGAAYMLQPEHGCGSSRRTVRRVADRCSCWTMAWGTHGHGRGRGGRHKHGRESTGVQVVEADEAGEAVEERA